MLHMTRQCNVNMLCFKVCDYPSQLNTCCPSLKVYYLHNFSYTEGKRPPLNTKGKKLVVKSEPHFFLTSKQ